eukprot:4323627-Alexandrium_andersonii.AAC.1
MQTCRGRGAPSSIRARRGTRARATAQGILASSAGCQLSHPGEVLRADLKAALTVRAFSAGNYCGSS